MPKGAITLRSSQPAIVFIRPASLGACLILAVGCQSRNIPVQGVALHKGQPVPGLVIYFHPQTGPAAWGQTDEQGKFDLLSDAGSSGIAPGDYIVTVEYDPRPSDPTEVMYPQMGSAASRPAGIDAVLAKYGRRDKSPLKVSIGQDTGLLKLDLD